MSTENIQPPRPRMPLVCTSKVYVTGGKVGLAFRRLNENGSLGEERIYHYKGLEHLRVGAVYDVEVDDQTPPRIYSDTFRWLRL